MEVAPIITKADLESGWPGETPTTVLSRLNINRMNQ
jgi:hypothetical protein